ncbi:MAG: hypothetical protein ACI9UO_000517 [Nitrospinales bacterium]|jgi:hypothetical protein
MPYPDPLEDHNDMMIQINKGGVGKMSSWFIS